MRASCRLEEGEGGGGGGAVWGPQKQQTGCLLLCNWLSLLSLAAVSPFHSCLRQTAGTCMLCHSWAKLYTHHVPWRDDGDVTGEHRRWRHARSIGWGSAPKVTICSGPRWHAASGAVCSEGVWLLLLLLLCC
jgi:hypothetical protein